MERQTGCEGLTKDGEAERLSLLPILMQTDGGDAIAVLLLQAPHLPYPWMWVLIAVIKAAQIDR